MATASKTPASVECASPDAGRREPNLFRFGLRQLFIVVSAAAGLCTLLAVTQGPWPWVIAFFAALVSAHICGNFLGTRLRDTSAEVRQWKALHSAFGPDGPAATPQPVRWADLPLPARTPLAWRQGTPRRLAWVVAGAAMASTIGGTIALALLSGEPATWPGVAAGAVSCGVIGAWIALAAASFGAIARQAWRHAQGRDNA